METTKKSSTDEVTGIGATEAIDETVIDEVRVEEPQVEATRVEGSQEEIVAEPTATRGARVKAGLEKSQAQVRNGTALVTRVVKGEQKFDTEMPFVWMLRVAAIVVAVLAPFAPVIATSLSGLLGYITDVVINLAVAYGIFATSNLIDVIYDIRDRLHDQR